MTQLSKEYATALFTLAKETSSEKEILDALRLVSAELNKNPDYIDFLSAPGIPKSERLDAIEAAFSRSVPEYVLSFLELLCDRSRIREFDSCLIEYEQLYNTSKLMSEAHITSAVELTNGEKAKLKAKLEKVSGRTLIMKYSVDSSVLGGVIVEIDGNIVDGSLKRRLREVKEVIDG